MTLIECLIYHMGICLLAVVTISGMLYINAIIVDKLTSTENYVRVGYVLDLVCHDLERARAGTVVLSDCGAVSWQAGDQIISWYLKKSTLYRSCKSGDGQSKTIAAKGIDSCAVTGVGHTIKVEIKKGDALLSRTCIPRAQWWS